MKKFLLCAIVALASAAGATAQTGLLKRAPESYGLKGRTSMKAPARAEAAAGQHWWGYVQDNSYRGALGTERAETVDQAILVRKDNAAVAGKTIKAVRFYLRSTTVIKDVKVWISTSLPTSAAAANVQVQSVDLKDLVGGDQGNYYQGKLNEVTLTTPYTVGDHDVYVGYSYTVTSATSSAGKYPIVLANEDGVPGSLYLHTASVAWQAAENYGPLDLRLLLEGDFVQNAAQPADFGPVYAAVGQPTEAGVTLTNCGEAGISSIDYTISADGVAGEEQHLDLATPCTVFGGTVTVQIPLVGDATAGRAQKVLTVTKVNGVANEASASQAAFTLITLPKMVKRGIVVEEYTGTGCPWCPRGLAGMEKMRDKCGDAFIGIGIHRYNNGDPMYISTYTQVSFSGAPSCRINRGEEIDPFYGTANDVLDDFNAALAEPAMAGISVSGYWNEDRTAVTAKAQIEPLIDGDYAIEYALIADDLSGTTSAWAQTNNYASYPASEVNNDPYLSQFCSGGKWGRSSFTGYPFNDVVIANAKQNQTTAPGQLAAGSVVTNSCTLSMPTKAALKSAIQYDKVFVVALLIDKSTNRIANAAKFCLADAQPPIIDDGKYYLLNVASGKYWGAGNDWGTRASLVEHPEYVTLTMQPDSTFHLESQVSNGGENYYFNGDYMDGQPIALTLAKAHDGTFTIANTAGERYGYDGSTTVLGKNVEGANAVWRLMTEKEMLATLSSATDTDPKDATFLILDPGFGRNNRNVDAWQVSDNCTNKNLSGGNNVNNNAESFHSPFTISQQLKGIPRGVYGLTAQGFYRQDGTDNVNLPYIFMNSVKGTFPMKTGSENSMSDASVSFSNGAYAIDTIYLRISSNTLTLGVELIDNDALWAIWDNFELKYYGTNADIDSLKNVTYLARMGQLVETAKSLLEQVDNGAVKAALNEALDGTAGLNVLTYPGEVLAAIAKLEEAIDRAEANLTARDILPAMKVLVDGTNVYTEEALDSYYAAPAAKYEAGTLTKGEALQLQDPSVVTGWRAAVTVDNFLLSAWDAEPDVFDGYYINTWSVEGDSDGTDFRVPFYEYWTADAESLAERTLTATLAVPDGEYSVEAWTRVRAKNGTSAPASGITLQVNDGTPVDVAAGQQVGGSQFFLDTFQAVGNVTDGVLTIKFNVAADNNISWLSFKNVKYTRQGEVNGISTLPADGQWGGAAIYNLNGQQMKSVRKGLYIQNGKKLVK